MQYYIDNFRGFQDTYIDLKSVNFLVGENSTGKTSFISAITVISDFRFWISGEIPAELIEYNSFEDLHSVNPTRDYFSMGIIDFNDDKSLHLLCFRDDNGLPIVFREIIYSNDQNLLVIEIGKNIIQYKNIQKRTFSPNDRPIQSILDYIDSREFKKSQSKELPLGNLKGQRLPFNAYKQILEMNDETIRSNYKKIKNYNSFFSLNVSYIAPIRAKPLPLYSGSKQTFNSEGNHTPFVLKEIMSNPKSEERIIRLLNEYGKESGLFDSISATTYGDKKISPFELMIERNKSKYKISSVGYGVSQVLPIVTELLLNQATQMITIQQPEVHLHPKAQAAFGAFLNKMALNFKKRKFVIETHSDYVIDRFRYQQKVSDLKVPSQILFFTNNGKNNNIQIIPISNDGKYAILDIDEYRSFFIDESFKMMEI